MVTSTNQNGEADVQSVLHSAPCVVVAGTFDTKNIELGFIKEKLLAHGIAVRTVDLSTSGKLSPSDVKPEQISAFHPAGPAAVFLEDRGKSVSAMASAFARWIASQTNIAGIIGAGGSGGTSLVTAGMRKLPVGIPKVMVSTIASSDVSPYVGPSDIMMIYSVADIQGINSITERILSNAANALAGMVKSMPITQLNKATIRPALGFTMFGVTTPCVQALQKKLEADYDCLIFHATGTGGRSMENLVDSGLLSAVFDITTTEVADMLVGGVMPADADRFGSIIRTGIPYVGSIGALDMVNFGPRNTVPTKFNARKFVEHNQNVTLMRTTRDENRALGRWIAERINMMQGPVRFLLPEGGVSSIDTPGKVFYDPEADNALIEAIEKTFLTSKSRKLQRVAANINDPEFIEAAYEAFKSITPKIIRRI